MTPGLMLRVRDLKKTFTLHHQHGAVLRVLDGVDLEVGRGECVVLHGPSGAGKSTLLRSLYANYRIQHGQVEVRHDERWVDMGSASARDLLDVRAHTIGYVSQFLRVIPRVPALEIVAEPLRFAGMAEDEAEARARALLARLHIPDKLMSLPPATFSGGEQQRVNIARGFIRRFPILLLDEPTAALDAANREIVAQMIDEARQAGSAIVGIFHDDEVRQRVATRLFPMQALQEAA
jgi:alpha-D-ribose 1-methylphosphonate 5-triphosphate synthase subunit PhnL